MSFEECISLLLELRTNTREWSSSLGTGGIFEPIRHSRIPVPAARAKLAYGAAIGTQITSLRTKGECHFSPMRRRDRMGGHSHSITPNTLLGKSLFDGVPLEDHRHRPRHRSIILQFGDQLSR